MADDIWHKQIPIFPNFLLVWRKNPLICIIYPNIIINTCNDRNVERENECKFLTAIKFSSNEQFKSTRRYVGFEEHNFLKQKTNLKLVSAIVCQIFIFSPNDSPLKTMKNVFYFIEKAPFVLERFKFL